MLNISTFFNFTNASTGKENFAAAIELLPYRREHDGPSSFEGRLSQIFRRIVREGLLQTGLLGATIRTTQDFINFMHSGHEIFFVRYNGEEAGLFWLEQNPEAPITARLCLYRDFSGKMAADIHQHCLETLSTATNRQGYPLHGAIRVVVPSTQKETLRALRQSGVIKTGKVVGMGMDYKANESIDGILFTKENRPEAATGTPLPRLVPGWRLAASSLAMILLRWW